MRLRGFPTPFLCLLGIIAGSALATAQQPASAAADSPDVAELRGQLQATRQQLSETQDKLRELGTIVADLQRQMAALKPEAAPTPSAAPNYPQNTQAAATATIASQAPARITEDEW